MRFEEIDSALEELKKGLEAVGIDVKRDELALHGAITWTPDGGEPTRAEAMPTGKGKTVAAGFVIMVMDATDPQGDRLETLEDSRGFAEERYGI